MCRANSSALPRLRLQDVVSDGLVAIDELSEMTHGFDGKCLTTAAAICFLSSDGIQFLFPKHLIFFIAFFFFNAIISVFITLRFVQENPVLRQKNQFICVSGAELEESWKLL